MIYFSAALILLTFGAGCKKKQVEISPEVASNDEQLFQLGQEYIKKDQEKGRLYLRQVIDSFPKSFYAQRAKLLIADSYFEKGDEGNMIIAASEYREFISLFPYSPSAPYAQTRIAETYFRRLPGKGKSTARSSYASHQSRHLERYKYLLQIVRRYLLPPGNMLYEHRTFIIMHCNVEHCPECIASPGG